MFTTFANEYGCYASLSIGGILGLTRFIWESIDENADSEFVQLNYLLFGNKKKMFFF